MHAPQTHVSRLIQRASILDLSCTMGKRQSLRTVLMKNVRNEGTNYTSLMAVILFEDLRKAA